MKIPSEFMHLAACFDPAEEESANAEEWPALALKMLDKKQKQVVKNYLDSLLDGSHSDEELERIWHKSGIFFRFYQKSGPRVYLKLIRDAIRL